MAQARPPTRAAAEAAARAEMGAGPTASADLGSRVADFLHGPLIQTIVMADRKAGILFTLVSAALLYLVTRVPAAPMTWQGGLWLAVVVALVVSAVCAFAVIFPRVHAQRTDILFWAGIARFPDAKSYHDAITRTDEAGLNAAKVRYCYDLARICDRKFRLLKVAMMAAAAGLILFLLELALVLPAGGGRLPPVV